MEQASATRISLLMRLRDACDGAAWVEFDRRYGPLILSYCRARGWQQSDAEDIRQLVMTKLSRRLRSFEYDSDAGGFRRYLRTVVRGEMARHASNHTDVAMLDSRYVDLRDADLNEALWEDEWMRHHFRLAWESVRNHSEEGSLEVFQRLLKGATPRQVAHSVGMSEAAVRKVKQRISDRLRAAITEQLLDEENEPICRR
jgi:RNA polymerase sigma factor (sigma-70 family)